MTDSPARIERTYLTLTAITTLATALIWGINTLFLLDAGLTNTQAFTANAFYTVGMVLFEIPTGVVADLRGRRLSFLLGALVLAAGTVAYWALWQVQAGFIWWAIASIMLGLGFTFFSGAVEAWVVDALAATGGTRSLDSLFGRGQAVTGGAMLIGSFGGGLLAQVTDLGFPFLVRAALLLIAFAVAFKFVRDLGFTARHGASVGGEMRELMSDSVTYGLRAHRARWLMLTSPWIAGTGAYVFYAAQPHLLNLWGDPDSYLIAGAMAAVVAFTQIIGGVVTDRANRALGGRSSTITVMLVIGSAALVGVWLTQSVWVAIGLLSLWGLSTAILTPTRRAALNLVVPSQSRATVLSFDSLLGSAGGVVSQPAFGRVADVSGYPVTFALSAVFQSVAIPFALLAHRQEQRGTTSSGR